MIPFVEPPNVQLGPLTLHVFGGAVAVALLVGLALLRRRIARAGLDAAAGEGLALWLVVGGFAGAHLFAVLAYFPGAVARDPWLLLRVWEHVSSFGAMIGGLVGAGLYFRFRAPLAERSRRWAYLDAVAFVFPFSLAIGRAGCALVHDHPGYVTDFPLAVSLEGEAARAFVARVYAAAGQSGLLPAPAVLDEMGFHDLGLYELAYLALVVLPVFAWLGRRPRPPGFFVCAFVVLYMPVRFGLDFLRLSDVRYAGLTPGQWAALLALAALPLVWRRAKRFREDGAVAASTRGEPGG